jgi:hypothetical protein
MFQLLKQDDVRHAHQEVLVAAAAVLSVKAKTGSFPASLPGSFRDPFSGGQMVYRHMTSGFLIYSVGPTGRFNGNPATGQEGWESFFLYPGSPPVPIPKDLL